MGGVEGSDVIVAFTIAIKVGLRILDSGEINLVLKVHQAEIEHGSSRGVEGSNSVVA